MKVKIAISLFLIYSIPFKGISQKDTLFIESIFEDYTSNLVAEKVIKVEGIGKNELINRFENWGGQNFRDYEKVKTSKTENQITINYINDGFLIGHHSVLIAEFKDEKVRIRYYDDGNVYQPAYYSGNTLIPAIPSRSSYLRSFFVDGKIVYKDKRGMFNISEKRATGLINYKNTVNKTLKSLEEFLLNENNSKFEKKDDW